MVECSAVNGRGRLDSSAGVVDRSHIRALRRGRMTSRSPVDRARTGSKHHLIVDRHGVPLAATLTGGRRNDAPRFGAHVVRNSGHRRQGPTDF
jgi:hypothetical protein